MIPAADTSTSNGALSSRGRAMILAADTSTSNGALS
jgi:hypothetical protein